MGRKPVYEECPPDHGPQLDWTWVDKARIALAFWAFVALDVCWFRPLSWLTRRRVYSVRSRLWLRLASEGYLYNDWRRGDLPPKHREGGKTVWG